MAKNEDGEFELVVGNRQLLSIVFILMVLFGVVFTMGYFVGRNSTPEAVAAAPARPTAEPGSAARPEPVEGVAPAERSPAPGGEASAGPELAKAAALGTQPVTPSPEASAEASAPAAQAAPAPETKPAETAAESRPASNRLVQSSREGPPGAGQTFLQVAAVKRPEAELIVDVLKKKGFPALVAPVPNDTLFRVLVGPLRDSATLAKTKADLDVAGFRSIIRKY